MRKKFKIMYPNDYVDPTKAGKPYLPSEGCMVVMNGQGIFFHVYMGDYEQHVQKLSEVLFKYDVVWKS
jgi:hypothetical protein